LSLYEHANITSAKSDNSKSKEKLLPLLY